MKRAAAILATLLLAASAAADDGKPPSSRSHNTGLAVFANANAYWASDITANFYSGTPTTTDNVDGIYLILRSNTYGKEIENDLKTNHLIDGSVNTDNFHVSEFANMTYRLSYQIGVGIRYDYVNGFGWLLRFDLAKLLAQGKWNLDNGFNQLGRDRYVTCGIVGIEDRINIDFVLTRTVALTDLLDFELNIGASLINTRVKDNIIEVNGHTYSILDRWNGQTPDVGVGTYEYINQGGVGYGFFATALLGYQVYGIGAIKVCYTCAQSKIVLQNYTAWGWQHTLGIRIEMNNFSFIQ